MGNGSSGYQRSFVENQGPVSRSGLRVVSTVAKGLPEPRRLRAPREGMTKSKTASSEVPELVTDASVPGSPVVTLPMVMVAAAPVGPVSPVGPAGPSGPISPVAPVGPYIAGGAGSASGPLLPYHR